MCVEERGLRYCETLYVNCPKTQGGCVCVEAKFLNVTSVFTTYIAYAARRERYVIRYKLWGCFLEIYQALIMHNQ